MELDLAAIERAPFVGFVGGPVYISAEERDALVAEVRHLRDENAALERKLNAALVDVVNMANEETAAAEAHEEALDRLRDVETLAREALAELDAQPELAHPDAVWYTGAALRDALEADRG